MLGQNPTFPHCLLSANLVAVVNSRASAGRVELTMYSSPRVVGFMALGALGSQGVALPSVLRGRIGLDLASWVALPVQQFSDSGEVRYTGEFRGFRVADAQGYALDPSGSSFVASNTGLVVE
jgi:hypothetical protein